MEEIEEGAFVLICHGGRRYLKRVASREIFHGKGGSIRFSDLLHRPFGIRIGEYEVYRPTFEDLIMHGLKRQTQIIYPKDSFFIALKMDLARGSKVLEIGTGSGALTLVFSRIIGPEGLVVSYERDERQYKNARRNVELFADTGNIRLLLGEPDGLEEEGFDAVFIDIKEPSVYVQKVHRYLKNSATLGMFLPTANQVIDVLRVLNGLFGLVEVMEILTRRYKTVAERLRPEDRMVAHTGYLVFGRKITGSQIS
jgi:tRNA (adenine57-N1/adenine58-N1)-methyltransferase